MDACFLDMFHDPGDVDGLPIADAVDIDLDRVVQVAVDQNRVIAGYTHRLPHVTVQAGAVVHDLHRPPAQYVTGPNHHREADPVGDHLGFARRPGDAVFRLQQAQSMEQQLEALAVFGDVDGIGGGAENGDPGSGE